MDKQKAIQGTHRWGIVIASIFIVAGTGICALLGRQIEQQHEHSKLAQVQQELQQQIAVRTQEAIRVKSKVESLQQTVNIQQQVIKSLSSRSSSPLNVSVSDWMQFEATWYSGDGGINGGKITATDTYVRNQWTCAVDPSVIPFGSLLEIHFSDGTSHVYEALDVGSAIKGRRIDIFDSNHAECVRKGKQVVEIRVITRG